MPFIRIDAEAGRYSAGQKAAISDVLFAAVQTIGAREGDRFQAFHDHAPGDLVYAPSYLGIAHTGGFIAIQITLVAGRTVEQKQGLFAFIARELEAKVGIARGDIFINLIETPKENWSFGNGEAQYA